MASSRCIVCGDEWVADAIANITLFLPVGVALALVHARGAAAWLAPVLLSAGIEFVQVAFIAGRDGSLADIAANGLGGVAGYLLVVRAHQWLRPARPMLAAWLAAVAVLLIVALTALLARPSFPRSVYWGQWTPRFGNVEWYRGRVIEADLAGIPIPSHRLERSADVRRRLLDGDTVRIRIIAGPAPERLAPVFSIADGDQRTILLVGARGADAELLVRRVAARVRLIQPRIGIDSAFSRLAAGAQANLTVRRHGPAWCLGVDAREWCRVGMTPGGGWRLLVSDTALPPRAAAAGDALWLLVLFAFVAFWGRGWEGAALAAAVLGLLCGVFPALLGLDAATPLAWGAGALGIAAGLSVGNRVARETGNRLL